MDIKILKTFIVVADMLSFSKAAKKLNISQSSISKQIKSLEEEIGVSLLKRGPKEVALTPEGVLFRERSKEFAVKYNRVLQELKNVSTKSELFRLGLVSPLVTRIMNDLIDDYTVTPGIKLSVREYISTSDFVANLLNGNMDMALCYAPVNHPDLENKLIHHERIMVAVNEKSLLAKENVITAEDIRYTPVILHPRETAPELYDHFHMACAQKGFNPNVVMEVSSQLIRMEMVARGYGVSFVLGDQITLYYRGVVFKEIDNTALNEVPIVAAWHKNSSQVRLINDFVKTFEDILSIK